jgi:hypothetical protein
MPCRVPLKVNSSTTVWAKTEPEELTKPDNALDSANAKAYPTSRSVLRKFRPCFESAATIVGYSLEKMIFVGVTPHSS